jgi:hypothetical protein
MKEQWSEDIKDQIDFLESMAADRTNVDTPAVLPPLAQSSLTVEMDKYYEGFREARSIFPSGTDPTHQAHTHRPMVGA